ncbi:MAG: hypothetical protein MZV65_15985 [Chromatiales bacterium]|nr:hypothetical protein [Chromatiales bacterium]
MKKLWFILLCAVAGSIGVFAQSACSENPWSEGWPGLTLSGPYAKEELSAIKADLGDQEFGDLSIARHHALLDTAQPGAQQGPVP